MEFTKGLAAPCIYDKDKIRVSYDDLDSIDTSYSLPAKQKLPALNVDDPKTDYHIWLEKYGDTFIDTLEQRQQLINIQEEIPTYPQRVSQNDAKSKKPTKPPKTNRSSIQVINVYEQEEKKRYVSHDLSAISNYNEVKLDETFMFKYLKKLDWRDQDEQSLTSLRLTRINKADATLLYIHLRRMIDTILPLYDSVFQGEGITDINVKYNILAHALAKGFEFYEASLGEPTLISYLVNQYQPLMSLLYRYITE